MPRFEGMPSNLHSSGSETPSPANGKGPVTQAPSPQPRPQQEQQSQQSPTRQQEAPAPRPPAPEATQAELVRAEKTEPEKHDQSSERQPAASPPSEQRPERTNIAEEVAEYLADGGPLGGGFAAPPVDTNVFGYDWTVQFRERVGMCSRVPAWVGPDDKVIRISFNRDGTVASPPRLLVPAPSAKQQALMDSAVDALGRCQPALYHATARKVQTVEDDGTLCHPTVGAPGKRGRVRRVRSFTKFSTVEETSYSALRDAWKEFPAMRS
jgi:hypothetical protein